MVPAFSNPIHSFLHTGSSTLQPGNVKHLISVPLQPAWPTAPHSCAACTHQGPASSQCPHMHAAIDNSQGTATIKPIATIPSIPFVHVAMSSP